MRIVHDIFTGLHRLTCRPDIIRQLKENLANRVIAENKIPERNIVHINCKYSWWHRYIEVEIWVKEPGRKYYADEEDI